MPAAQARERLNNIFYALSDESRREMINRLSKGPASVKELAGPLNMRLPSAVKHLSVLEKSGLARSEKKGRVRTYYIPNNAFLEIENWVEKRKSMMNRNFDKLEEFLALSGHKK